MLHLKKLLVFGTILFSGCHKTLEKTDRQGTETHLQKDIFSASSPSSTKKGACFSTNTTIGTWYANVDSVKPNWYYTWGDSVNPAQAPALEFVPMFWGKSNVTSANIASVINLKNQGKAKYVLGFNEPDISTQSNMPVDTALAYWPKLESIGLPLGSPAVSWPTVQWLADFMDSCKSRNLRVDFICVHMYVGTNDTAFVQTLQNLYNTYHLPIWITEFATCYSPATTMSQNPYSPAQVLSFMQRLLPQLEDLSFVQRYSWFSGSPTSPSLWSSALINSNGTLTPLGVWYAGYTSTTGDGSSGSPFMVYSASGFANIANAPTANYKVYGQLTLPNTWSPIANFSGTLDGNGYQVNGLTISNTSAYGGLVSNNTGTIKNLQLLNVNCTTSNSFGTVAGSNTGIIQNVIVSGSVTATQTGDVPVGGIVGDMTGTGLVTQCYAKLNLTVASNMAGGIVGRINGGTPTISNCASVGNLTINAASVTPTKIGGILGRIVNTSGTAGKIQNCSSSMVIQATGTNATGVNCIGGIFGADQGTAISIDQCIFTGSITAGFSIGGIAGVGTNITNCIVVGNGSGLGTPSLYANGTSPATGSEGGIAGTGKNLIQYCIVKNSTISAVSTPSILAIGGIASTYQNNGYTANCVVINSSISGSATSPNNQNAYRVSGSAANGTGANANNYVGPNVTTPGRTTSYVNSASGLDGLYQSSMPFTFFTGLGFSGSLWKTDTDGYPTLVNAGYNGGYALP